MQFSMKYECNGFIFDTLQEASSYANYLYQITNMMHAVIAFHYVTKAEG
jgi:hypothetical protein